MDESGKVDETASLVTTTYFNFDPCYITQYRWSNKYKKTNMINVSRITKIKVHPSHSTIPNVVLMKNELVKENAILKKTF